jgi:murein DD-endopeptidase MepM/ murein hydrolase activator NlpD
MTLKKRVIGTLDELNLWRRGWRYYAERRLVQLSHWFEKHKDSVVDMLMVRRGMYQRPFLHFSVGVLFVTGIFAGPILADSYPRGGVSQDLASFTPPSAVLTSLDFSNYGVATERSDKPRDQVEEYTVEKGDTLSTVADKFGVSTDSIRWANDSTDDSLTIGEKLKIPPTSGIIHKVREGETIYTIAKKYRTDAQKIVNFPFNEFADLDSYGLSVGQTLVVPDGIMPQAPAPVLLSVLSPPPSVSTGSAPGSGQLGWPTNGIITQYPIWYHKAFDIANPSAPPVTAAGSGTVVLVQVLRYDYGRHIIIDHGGGLSTLYAHLSESYVNVGDKVNRGQVIGRMGSTGRSTGTHLHFEVRVNGVAVINPGAYLK